MSTFVTYLLSIINYELIGSQSEAADHIDECEDLVLECRDKQAILVHEDHP
jgi:hypothetical protein